MDPSRTLFDVWNWLPAFRAAAEDEHLPTASRRLGISPSALSRTIRTLEDRVGRPLFHRGARNITLNVDGQRLLGAVVGAMQLLGVALAALNAPDAGGPIHAQATGAVAQALIAPALGNLTTQHPTIVPHVRSFEASDVPGLLRSGLIDVALSSEPHSVDGIESAFLGEAPVGIYCGRSHPLYEVESPTESDLLAHSFVAGCVSSSDALPPTPPWHVAAFVSQPEVMTRLCADGKMLAIIPELSAQPLVASGVLRRLPVGGLQPAPVYASRRRDDVANRRADAFVTAVRAVLDRCASPSA